MEAQVLTARHDGTPDVLLKTDVTANEIKFYYQHKDPPLMTPNRTGVRNIAREDFLGDAAIVFRTLDGPFKIVRMSHFL